MANIDQRRMIALRIILELTCRAKIPELVRHDPGILIGQIADEMCLSVDLVQPQVRRLVREGALRTEGRGRGTGYFPGEGGR
jgi:predicted transcriptional regulator